ncbi:MAG: glycoside hydrolase family 3 C-terminal domain-containing protein [Opitutaceae bacterium]|nr:glycoside hydrolase family 3 C-terminal domain-containing protein [Opitutaceae bacterium]
MNSVHLAASCAVWLAIGSTALAAPYLDRSLSIEQRVDELLSRLTLEEKVSLLHANSKFTVPGIPRLGIPERWLDDGPFGVREDIGPHEWKNAGRTDDFSTAMPAGIALASTWDPDLAVEEGRAIGEEAVHRNKHMMLGPAINIMRTPVCGRNFEYFGEDPFLCARLAVGYIRGMQTQDVAGCVKHYAVNNQEWERLTTDTQVDERTLREIYLPGFRAAVQEGGVWAVMAAYNRFRGQFCCHNDYLLNQVLKKEWGFRGLVVSDWGGVHDTSEAALHGLDLEMGTEEGRSYEEYYLARDYLAGLKSGAFPSAGLDEKVRRNLRVMFATGLIDGRRPGSFNTPAHQEIARRVAEEGMVLLKNEGRALPLDASSLRSIAIIGENATRLQANGGGSAIIKPLYEISPLEGILRRVGSEVTITHAAGYRTAPSDKPQPTAAELTQLADRAVAAARAADVVVFVGGLNHDRGLDCEGVDRADLSLPAGQSTLIQRLAAANPRLVVVLVAGAPVEMGEWLQQVPAVLMAWYGGMEAGNAVARLLFGDVSPSGKLPCTFPKRLADSPAHALGTYPGKDGVVRYDEGLLVGYRWFDTREIAPEFPFGHGLSYSRFEYSNLCLSSAADGCGAVVTFDLANTGAVEAAEIAQVYVCDPQSSLPRPAQELKGFAKVRLAPGAKQTISVALGADAFAFYDPAQKAWIAEAGAFAIRVGSSSRDVRLEGGFHLTQTATLP